jgi:two-component system, cell cycle sensor histidine kinase and response regulator CckA
MEAVGQLAGGVAHDFNNLLQVIQGYNEIALQTSANHVETHESLVQVQLATNRATTLVRQLLAFSRKQLLILEDIDLSATVSDLAKMIQRVIGKRIAFDIISDTGLKSVHVDKGQIEQVLMNLCVNARDAMPDGGTLTIETGTADLDEEFCRANDWAKPGEFVVLRVSDTGCGIDEETKRHIYEPFFTTKQVGKGTGLGLSTVFGIVRQHKGTIEVQSELGVGTTFKLYLPRLHDATTDPKEPEVTRPVGGTETILLADDDTAVLTFGTALLEKAGYTVLAAADGKEAIDVLDTHGSKVDLTILDVVMPELDGKAVYEHIQMRWPHIPVLFVSGHNAEGKHADFILQKGTHFIHKPYEGDVVLQKNARTPRYGAIAEVSRSPVIQIATSAHLRPIPSPSLRLTLLPVP